MRVQLTTNIEGTESGKRITWEKGKVFNDAEAKIPADIIAAVKAKSHSVVVLDGPGQAPVVVSKEVDGLKVKLAGVEKEKVDLGIQLDALATENKELKDQVELANIEIAELKQMLEVATEKGRRK